MKKNPQETQEKLSSTESPESPESPESQASGDETPAQRLRRVAEARLAMESNRVPANLPDAVEALHELHVHQVELEMQNEELASARAETEAALARYTHLYDFAPVGYCTLAPDSTIRRINLAGAQLLGAARSRLLQRRFGQYILEADRPVFFAFLEKTFSGSLAQDCEIRLIPESTNVMHVAHLNAICDDRADECRMVVSDITHRKESEARLELAASVFTHAQEGIMIMDASRRIMEINRSFSEITGFTREEVLGQEANMLVSGCQEPGFYAKLWADLLAKGHWYGEIWDRRRNSELYAAMLKINAVRDARGNASHFVAMFSDITALKEHQTKLERLAHYDALTGLPNRVLLADRLQHAMAQARRRGNFMALVYLDLDGFKAINDTHGHEAGDELLIIVAQRLKEALREGDTLARLGGDEFIAVLADLGSTGECELILSRLLQAAAAPVHIREQQLAVSASLGVTLSPQDTGDADVLLRHADQAMYEAKQAGKNRFHMFDPEHDQHARTHRETLQRISLALKRNEFVLHYQPKIDMRHGRIIGAEALLRWQHPERGLLLPDEFLTVAEDNEMISQIGEWVLDTAIEQIVRWKDAGMLMPVSVNIAAYHLQQDDFLFTVRDKLAAHPELQPEMLELEVLETAALADITRISRVISTCQGLGIEFSLDDFGTGYSSLTYLKRLPATTLKIDQSFVRNMLWDKEDLAIVEGVIGLATAFGRHVVAEGVESIDHAKMLLRLGCDRAQGSCFSPALPADVFPGWVRDWRPDPNWQTGRNTLPGSDNLILIYAEVDHRQWIRRIENMLNGKADALPPFESDTCQYGKWHARDGTLSYGNLPEFQAIPPIHEYLHDVARETLALHAAGKNEAAKSSLADLLMLRDEFVDCLRQLSAATVSAGTRPHLRKAAIPLF